MSKDILDNSSVFVLFYKWRKKIAIVTLIAAVIAAIVSLFIPNKYQSEVILFPTKHISSGHALFYEHSDFMEIGESQELEYMMQVLHSNEIAERVIQKFDLINHYEIDTKNEKYQLKLYEKYGNNVSSEITKYSSIKISVLDTDPQMAADMANEIAVLIDTVINKMQHDRAAQAYFSLKKDREFVMHEIEILEDSLAKIRSYGINDYESQSEVLNEQWAVAKIENNPGAISSIEKKLDVLSKYGGHYTALRDDLLHAHSRLSTIDKRINEIKVTSQEALTHTYILNAAVPALRKSYPIRWLNVVITACSTAFFMMMVIAFDQRIKQIK